MVKGRPTKLVDQPTKLIPKQLSNNRMQLTPLQTKNRDVKDKKIKFEGKTETEKLRYGQKTHLNTDYNE